MKTRLVVRDGKVVELKEEDLRSTKKEQVFSIGKASGLTWGKREYQQTKEDKEEYLKRLHQSLNII